ncbi:hypothetical protein [Nocardioides sp.]|uniref:hypothetical protein n=1 Tax=Nocardioides sp. TaxID=35761 RepID=UPI002B27BFBE|nr:hypothetical protein [Nocardioides sp.]
MTHSSSPTRRSLIKAGAWTAPAIVLATAAPTFAASGSRAFAVAGGGTAVVNEFGLNALQFRGFSITAASDVGKGELTITVTNPDRSLTELGTPDGWTLTSSSAQKLVYTNTVAAKAGQKFVVPNGTYLNDSGGGGAFVVTVSAPDHDRARITFAIPE